jgi:hypothetical protein
MTVQQRCNECLLSTDNKLKSHYLQLEFRLTEHNQRIKQLATGPYRVHWLHVRMGDFLGGAEYSAGREASVQEDLAHEHALAGVPDRP